jgi:hypothetical protein
MATEIRLVTAVRCLESSAATEQKDQQGDNQNDAEDADPATGSVRRIAVVTTAASEQEHEQNYQKQGHDFSDRRGAHRALAYPTGGVPKLLHGPMFGRSANFS